MRFDGDPNDPLKCSFDGKRREKATLSIEGKTFPSTHLSDAGRDQGEQVIPKPSTQGKVHFVKPKENANTQKTDLVGEIL